MFGMTEQIADHILRSNDAIMVMGQMFIIEAPSSLYTHAVTEAVKITVHKDDRINIIEYGLSKS